MAKKDVNPAVVEMIRKKRLPVLILDSRWQQLFPPEQKKKKNKLFCKKRFE